MIMIEKRRYDKKHEKLSISKKDEKEIKNVKRRVYDALYTLGYANIIQKDSG